MAARHPLPYAFAKANGLLLECDDTRTTLWASPTVSASALSEVMRLFEVNAIEHEPAETLTQRIATAYAAGEGSAAAVVGEVESAVDLSRMMQDLPAVEDLLEASNDAPIIRMLNALLTQAAKDGASDIHIEPYERSSAVRFRVDGTLREVVQPNKALHAALISRLKIMAELDISEKRLPQDGRISLRIGGRAVDVRVSTLPSAHGERAVLRLLDKGDANKFTLESLGMSGESLDRFKRLLRQPHGIVLVTGPTGSGKTTTLYAGLSTVDSQTTNVLTVEDPVEYELPGIGQTQVNPKIELTFAKALRAILRQDPDVIMIGEIRDLETAQIAVQASLTGHLVLATLHTNDAPSAVTRLTDMGIEPFLLSSSLLGVLAQRQAHHAAVIWSEEADVELRRLEKAAETLALHADTRQILTVMVNAGTLWVWTHGGKPIDMKHLQQAVKALTGVRMAMGSSGGHGIEGFRRGHLDALSTQRLMSRLQTSAQVVGFNQIRLVSLMMQNMESARQFIAHTLGELATADPALRKVLHTFLESGCNAKYTAEVLHLHRNTFLRRLARAEELLPRPLADSRVHVAAALEVLNWSDGQP